MERGDEGRGLDMAESSAQDREWVDGVDAAAGEGELPTRPVYGGVVSLKPVKTEDHRVWDGDNAESQDFAVLVDS